MATTDTPHDILTVRTERERVCLCPGPLLDVRALSQLENEARSLMDRGFTHVAIELRKVETFDWTTAATLAAIARLARRSGVRLTVVAGSSPAVRELIGAGLLQDLTLDTHPRAFFDWSR
jgi:anti-anti-sigma regulatory factor